MPQILQLRTASCAQDDNASGRDDKHPQWKVATPIGREWKRKANAFLRVSRFSIPDQFTSEPQPLPTHSHIEAAAAPEPLPARSHARHPEGIVRIPAVMRSIETLDFRCRTIENPALRDMENLTYLHLLFRKYIKIPVAPVSLDLPIGVWPDNPESVHPERPERKPSVAGQLFFRPQARMMRN